MRFRWSFVVVVLALSMAQGRVQQERKQPISNGAVNFASVAVEASCSKWMKQDDGSYWRTCVDDNGRQYCEVSKDGHISRVKCSVS